MRIINENAVTTETRNSPKGKFTVSRRHMSLALGGIKDIGQWGGGQPFDVEVAIIPPGKANYPLHSHAAQTEYYIVLSGSGRILDSENQSFPIKEGDHFIAAPGIAHQLVADSGTGLKYIVIADHHMADITTYPKTGKRLIKPEYRVINVIDTDYYAGEE
jgi:uncharacterized cupin superfamily protein